MCLTNTAKQVCGVPIYVYEEKDEAGSKPTIHFCDDTRGTILNTILASVDQPSRLANATPESPNMANALITTPAKFWHLVAKCQLDFDICDKAGVFNRLIIASFRDLVKYIQRKAVVFKAVVYMPAGWTRALTFDNDQQAGTWFREKLDQLASSTPASFKSQNSTRHLPAGSKAKSLSSSRWSTAAAVASSIQANHADLLPALEQLSLDHGHGKTPLLPHSVSDLGARMPSPAQRSDEAARDEAQNILGNRIDRARTNPAEPEAAPGSIEDCSDGVRSEVSPPAMDLGKLARRLESLGRERSDMLKKLVGIDRAESELWAHT
ncbi:hypothetical protein FZEAL_8099 [Fusarium zealandicum]|uniref:Uncharacterized protein n=1 Tax=Fusarium zealandicum TaxID=1053134 RepID=A0A8H4UEF7_9HYPO|nr:hypothetical protein FZEAL_8099 [Fusarium zealandicum]